jgi:O-antigen/teichoic acid export membrane protein
MTDLRARVVSGAGWTALQKWAVRASGLVIFALLSRLLGPADIGLAALAMAVTALFAAVTELSLSAFLVRADDPDARTFDTVFWTGVGASTVTAVVVAVLADPIGTLLGSHELSRLVVAMCPLLPLSAIGAVPGAILERRLAFKAIATREMLSALIGGAIGVTLAATGAGVWALVGQAWGQTVTAVVFMTAVTRWRPSLSFSSAKFRELLRFGGPLLGVQLCQTARDRGEQILLGAILGVDALGTWAIATRLLGAMADLSISVLDVVALPVFAQVRANTERFRRVYEGAVSSCQALLVPILVVLAVGAPVIVPHAFGNAWTAAVVPTQVLSLGYAIAGLSYFNRAVFVVFGRLGTELGLTVGSVVVHFAVVLAVAPHGVVPLAFAMAAEAAVTVAVGAFALSARVGLRPPLSRRALLTVACGVVGSVGGLAFEWWARPTVLPHTILAVLLALALFAVGMWWLNRSLVVALAADVRRVTRSRGAAPAESQ